MNICLSPLTNTSVGSFRWALAPGLRDVLLGPDGLRLPEWLRDGLARVIKQGPHRVVYRVDLPDLSFYLKHNLVPDGKAVFRQLVRVSKARTEYQSALVVAARGIPTIQPLALGEQQCWWGTGESYLITRAIEDTQPLNHFLAGTLPSLPPTRRTRVRQRLSAELGTLVARIHDAGILHNDLHSANLLVRLSDDDRVSLFVIDLNSLRVGPSLDWDTSRKNLIMLNSWFVPRVSRADRYRFWKAYFLARKMGSWRNGPYAERAHVRLARDIEEGTWAFNLAFWRHRDRRCLKINRYYRKVRGPGVFGHAVSELDPEGLARLVRDPDRLLAQPGVKLLKDSPSGTVAELQMRVNGQLRTVIYKRFRVNRWTDPLAALVRLTPALRSWVHGQGFRERGLPTARPLAVLHHRRLGLLREGYLITEKVEHAEELQRFVARLQELPEAERRALMGQQIDRVARVIRELHLRQLSHRDLKAANILVRRWDAPPTEPEPPNPHALLNLLHMPESPVWLIDLVGVELFRTLSRARKVQNLARLNASFFRSQRVTRTDRLRFLRTYLDWAITGRGDWKSWWRQVARATEEKIARNVRRGRPLG